MQPHEEMVSHFKVSWEVPELAVWLECKMPSQCMWASAWVTTTDTAVLAVLIRLVSDGPLQGLSGQGGWLGLVDALATQTMWASFQTELKPFCSRDGHRLLSSHQCSTHRHSLNISQGLHFYHKCCRNTGCPYESSLSTATFGVACLSGVLSSDFCPVAATSVFSMQSSYTEQLREWWSQSYAKVGERQNLSQANRTTWQAMQHPRNKIFLTATTNELSLQVFTVRYCIHSFQITDILCRYLVLCEEVLILHLI